LTGSTKVSISDVELGEIPKASEMTPLIAYFSASVSTIAPTKLTVAYVIGHDVFVRICGANRVAWPLGNVILHPGKPTIPAERLARTGVLLVRMAIPTLDCPALMYCVFRKTELF